MASTVILKASGLYTSPNHLSIPEGALSEAKNIIIKRDGIIEQRRGFKLYGSELPLASDRVDQLTVYRNTLLRHYDSKLQFESAPNIFQTFLGDYLPADPMLRMKFIEAAGNLFFTTSNGIQKLSSRTAAGLSSAAIVKAGAVKAIDLEAETVYVPNLQTGFLPQDSAVSYRVLWAYKDANNNLIQGSPSQRELVYNRQIDLMLRDYMRFLSVLDSFENTPLSTARINDKNYVSLLGLQAGSTTGDLRARLITLAAKLDNDILYADKITTAPLQIGTLTIAGTIATLTFTSGNPNNYLEPASLIYLSGFTPATGVLDGAQTVVGITATTITFNTTATGAVTQVTPTIKSNEFRSITQPAVAQIPPIHLDNMDVQDYFSNILAAARDLPELVISSADQLVLDEIDITTSTNVQLTITIPQDVDSRYFYQVYRSAIFSASDQQSIDDVIPNDELQLVYEAYPTAQELIDREVVITDVTPDDFRGANLYTNNSTGEGILQSNDPPPYAKDINRYRNVVFYANTRTKHTMLLNLLGVQSMINDYNNGIIPSITIANADTVNTYPFVTGLNEITTITTVADVADSLNGKYFLIDATTGSKFYVWFESVTGATDPAISGRTGIKVSIDTNDTSTVVANRLRDALSIYLDDFIVSSTANVVTVENVEFGALNDAQDVNTGFSFTVTQQGRGERVQTEISTINAIAGASFVSSGVADYFQLSTALNREQYYFWFKSGTSTSPALTGKIGINIDVTGTETADQVAQKIVAALPAGKFQAEVAGNVVTIENTQYGVTSPISENVLNAGFTVSTVQQGAIEVLLSTNASPAISVDETARSLIRVINRNEGDSVYGFYLSGAFDVPGKMVLEARNLEVEDQFFVLANNKNTGSSFNPDISPDAQILSITTGQNPVITTDVPHGLENLDFAVLGATDSQPSVDGVYEITYISPTSFSINKFVSVAGTKGAMARSTNAVTSENDVKQNRVYYSKYSQPEAVPVSNYFDVGAEDKQILRIFPLRDSLFIFKEDGLYRISGESAPFTLDLFDSSFIVTAPDSVNVCNNVLFAWTTQGIQSLTESGGSVVSRAIDNLILKLGSVNYKNFKTATFGVGYESDNSFLIWTIKETNDTVATIAYRFSTLTQTWTTYDLSATAGIVNSADDKLYFGAGDTNYITQERKLFDRTDYADREIAAAFANNFLVSPGLVKLNSVVGYEIGDVLTQDQTITTFEFNTFLNKLDNDPGVSDSNYLSSLELKAGNNPRNRLLALATKLDNDAGVATTNFASSIADYSGAITNITDDNATVLTSVNHKLVTGRVVLITNSNSTPSINGTYSVTVLGPDTFSIPVSVKLPGTTGSWQTLGQNEEDLKNSYNLIVTKLNLDSGVAFNNYRQIDNNTLQESIITNINRLTRQVTLNLPLDYLVGDITIFKAIETSATYLPVTMGDPLSLKHIREATLMYENRNITGGSIFFASDLMPELIEVPFKLSGNGIFGHSNFGAGYFGGMSNSAPMRTYIPRQCQRCRYLVTKVLHKTAREDYRLLGITLTGNESLSPRAYR